MDSSFQIAREAAASPTRLVSRSKAEIAVICSTDDDFQKISSEIFEKLHDKAIIVIAGYPKDLIDELKSIGIHKFIHNRSNVLESLMEFQEEIGVK